VDGKQIPSEMAARRKKEVVANDGSIGSTIAWKRNALC